MLYRFHDCRLDVTQREFVRAGTPTHLTPKAFDLLTALIEQRPRVVGKDELIQRVWPDAFVADVNLTVLMAEIRSAIGDPARSPRLIRTVHRRGYAFIGDVTEEARRARVPLAGPTAVLRVGTRRIILDQGDSSVGRDPRCDVVINDVSISRKHAVITVRAGTALVADESKNGTRVGGRRVKAPTPLASGDVITFGTIDTEFTIEAPEGASTLSVESPDE
jgi:DNA-binding winged helix-turn-helix (wHTH) protein